MTTIKHLVFSGGAYRGIYMIGALNKLIKEEFIKLDEIKTIHCVSVGSLIASCICLKLDFNNLSEFVINKPWDKLFDFNTEYLFKLTTSIGLYDINIFYDIYSNILKWKGLKKDITLKELFLLSNIELYIYSTNLYSWKKECFSYKTHPDLKLIEAVYMSSTLPCVFTPLFMNNTYYLDGGLINSYPLNECLDCSFNKNEILSIVVKNERSNEILNNNNNNNIFTFGWSILNNILNKGQDDYYKNGSIKYELIIPCQNLNFNEAIKMIKEKSNREEIINEGEKYANLFLNYITKQCL